VYSTAKIRMLRFTAALVVLTAAILLVAPLTMWSGVFPADNVAARALLFYAITAGAYAFLPFVRRGDIFMVSMWLMLAVGIAPCFAGQELNAHHMFADMAGVLLAAGPIYIARFRQRLQGDLRQHRRRDLDGAL
jgi:hypothetical protein